MQVVKVSKRVIIRNFVIAMLCVAFGWYLKAKITPQGSMMMGGAQGAAHVLVEEALLKDVSPQKQYIAAVEPIKSVNLIPQVSGYIEKVLFQEGSIVQEGDVLFIIEQDRYLANVDLAKAALTSAQANFVRAERDYNRQKALSTKQYASKSTLDTAESAYLQAKAAVAQAKANLELAQIDLMHTEIKAPISGKIGKALVTEGNLVSSNSVTLARIVQNSPIRVAFSVPDKDHYALKTFKSGELRTRLSLPDNSILEENALSAFIDNEINPNTATLAVYLEYENSSNQLIAGNYVDVIVSSANETKQVIINPAAVMQDANGAYVFTVNDEGLVTEQRVKLDGTFEGKQIVLEGLKGGEKVIVNGLQKAKDGASVRASLISDDSKEAK
ncbi:MAG: efflux RND transporter periplasmic adaptor subunit [Alphaproteobacteria bacterium]|nr:efflux RND transporter periplasmic adaptor subunit [Alphaproteobacteria bacterium]MBQ9235559.1 efflux RND transporter periplasmic adaptor subunit [Alphaproteobacteria bacterium]